ncbi:MAG: hypothetical protein JJT85_00535 [Chromatiales bacterium]|nr:hypothetical protein [Chromatiales bacterium]
MPNNRVIYAGMLILVVTVLIWIGVALMRRIEWMLPWIAGLGVLLIVAGFVHELWKKRRGPPAA